MPPIITLTTDFGTRDAYVAAMKGVLLARCPDARLVDVSHDVAPQDVMEAAFVLREAVPHFPPGTVHLAVVDPGVGTARRALALSAGDAHFVGPDNGLFALVIGDGGESAAVVLDRAERWRTPEPSATFHGRDIFAPAAGALAAGTPLDALGSPAGPLSRMHWATPIADDDGIQGWIAHVDRFGNCITNIPAGLLASHRDGRALRAYVGGAIVDGSARTYGDVAAGEALLLVGSHGMLELAVNAGNAAELFGIERGAAVHVVFHPPA